MTDLGTLPGCINSEALAINANGQVVGTCQAVGSSGNDQYAFLYSNGKMTGLGTLPGGADSWAYGINSNGQVVGNTYTLTPSYSYQAFLYGNGTATALGGFDSVAHAVNDNGQVAGWNNVNGTHAFLYGNGTMTDLGTLPGDSFSYGYGINASGSVVGTSYTNTNSYHAFLYSNGKMTNLGTLPWCSTSEAYGINAGGQVVGDSDGHAFLYSNGAMIDLDPLHGTSYARGINDSGQAVGYFVSDSGDRAFLYSGGTSTDLNSLVASSWTLERAYAINDAGQIVGYGYNPQGQQDALLLTPVPEPSTFVLLSIGAAALLAYGWRKRGSLCLLHLVPVRHRFQSRIESSLPTGDFQMSSPSSNLRPVFAAIIGAGAIVFYIGSGTSSAGIISSGWTVSVNSAGDAGGGADSGSNTPTVTAWAQCNTDYQGDYGSSVVDLGTTLYANDGDQLTLNANVTGWGYESLFIDNKNGDPNDSFFQMGFPVVWTCPESGAYSLDIIVRIDNYSGGLAEEVVGPITSTPSIPEPSALTLLGSALLGLSTASLVRRRRAAA